MSITELLSKVGDSNVTLQNILHSSPCLNKGKRDGTISFHTSNENVDGLINEAMGKPGVVALVIWIPRDKIPFEQDTPPFVP